jgi:hypothetical protein
MLQAEKSQQSFEEECFLIVRSLFRSEGYVREWMRQEIPALNYMTPAGYAQEHGLDGLRKQVTRLKHLAR